MGRVFCLPVFSRKANKLKIEFQDGDESFTVVSMSPSPASTQTAATSSPQGPAAAVAHETQSCYYGEDAGEQTPDRVATIIEVGDTFSDPGLYGRDFGGESCATSTDGNNAVTGNAFVLTLPEDNDGHDDHGQNYHVQEDGDSVDDEHDPDPRGATVSPRASDIEDNTAVTSTATATTTITTTTTSLDRVEEWVKNLDISSTEPLVELLVGETSSNGSHAAAAAARSGGSRDIELANSVARSLDFHSSVAHFTGLGLTLIPCLSTFSHLKVLKLSANSIVRITPGLLPKGLHSLDLSRNKISVIEGLRELTKLRSLNLSHNRILRIGQGLANCTSIRELNLSNNKISEVEGLHRLTKLSCLDLSFNRLSSTKSLGQIAATYTSLMAVNLVGNPVVVNVGEEQLKRFVTGLAPNLIVLNKQPVRGGVSSRDAVARSLVAGSSSSSRHSPHHGTSASKRSSSNAAAVSTAAAVAAAAALRSRGHHHHHHQQQQQQLQPVKDSRILRVQSDGALCKTVELAD